MAITGRVKKIFYVGDDDQYWSGLVSNFKKYYLQEIEDKELVLEKHFNKTDPNFHRLFISLLKNQPDVIYLDFSQPNTERVYNLSKLLRRCNGTKDILVVGLMDLVDAKKLAEYCLFADLPFFHLKGGEKHDPVYDAYTYKFPNEAHDPGFARAPFDDETHMGRDLRVCYMERDSIRLEGNADFKEGEKIKLEWSFDENFIPAKTFIVTAIHKEDHYYQFKNAFDLDYCFITQMSDSRQKKLLTKYDDPYAKEGGYDQADLELAGEGDEEEMSSLLVFSEEEANGASVEEDVRLELMEEEEEDEDVDVSIEPRPELIKLFKRRLMNWIKMNSPEPKPRKCKILIVDKEMQSLLKFDKSVGSYNYSLRFQCYLEDMNRDIGKYRPDVIIFQFEQKPKVDSDKINPLLFNSAESLKELMAYITANYEYNPIVVIFNNPTFTSSNCRDAYEYAHIIVAPGLIDINIMRKLGDTFNENQKKKILSLANKKLKELVDSDPQKYADLKVEELYERRLYLPKESDISLARQNIKIHLISITESELMFKTEIPLYTYEVFSLTNPLPLFVTVVPKRSSDAHVNDAEVYRALIHGISEVDKQTLRRFVNSLLSSSDVNTKSEIARLKKKYFVKDK